MMNLRALHQISYGMYIIGSKKGDSINGQVANSVMQITAEPVKVAVSINKQNLTHEYIQDGGCLTISILERETPLSFIGRFGFKSGRDIDKFSGINYSVTTSGMPYVIDHVLAYMEARVVGELVAGTHTIFLGEVVAAEILKEGEPMTYAYYHQVKRGTTPMAAPTYGAFKTDR